jgi:TonB family protein
MKRILHSAVAVLLFSGVALCAQNNSAPTEKTQPTTAPPPSGAGVNSPTSGVDILSDTKGVDFTPYLGRAIATVRKNWFAVMPASARAPERKQGHVAIEFAILKDGKLGARKRVESSGDAALDRAAEAGIAASSPLAALPSEFAGEYLALRVHFYYNRANSAAPAPGKTERSPGGESALPAGVYRVSGNVTAPRPILSRSPAYSEEARHAKLVGTVILRTIIGVDGIPRDVEVVRALGQGLDEKAVAAVRGWRFKPATKDGKPVPVQINIEVTFKLK